MRTDDDKQEYGKGGDENRCFGFHGHLLWSSSGRNYFREKLSLLYLSRCGLRPPGCSI